MSNFMVRNDTIDPTEAAVLRALARSPRASLRSLAAAAGVAVSTASRKMESLSSRGILRGFRAVIDWDMLGYDLFALIEVTASQGRLTDLEREIGEDPRVVAVYDVTGATDVIVLARFPSRSELSDFVKGLLSDPRVERTNTRIILNVVKEDDRGLVDLIAGAPRRGRYIGANNNG